MARQCTKVYKLKTPMKTYIPPKVDLMHLDTGAFMDAVSTHTSTSPATGGHSGGRAPEFAWDAPIWEESL